MAVCFKVDTNIEAVSRVMKILDASRSTDDGQLQNLLDVLGRSSVGIGCLDNANLQLVGKARCASQFCDEDCA